MLSFSVMLTALGVPPMVIAPSTLLALVSVMRLVVGFRVVVPVVVQAPLCVIESFSVRVTAPPVSVSAPIILAAVVNVMALSFNASRVTGTPVSGHTAP